VLGLAIGAWLTEQTYLHFLDREFSRSALSLTSAATLPTLLGVSTAWIVAVAAVFVGFLLLVFPKPALSTENWPWYRTGLILGVLGSLAWIAGAPSGWHWGLSMIGPSRSLLRVILEQTVNPMTWGAFMLLGVPLGSWLSAHSTGTTHWQVPDALEFRRRFLGGFAMGVGGTLAAGCNIGNALTGLSVFSLNSVVATGGIVVGLALGVRVQEYQNRR